MRAIENLFLGYFFNNIIMEILILYAVVIVFTLFAPTWLAVIATVLNIFIPDASPMIDEAIQIGICMKKMGIV